MYLIDDSRIISPKKLAIVNAASFPLGNSIPCSISQIDKRSSYHKSAVVPPIMHASKSTSSFDANTLRSNFLIKSIAVYAVIIFVNEATYLR